MNNINELAKAAYENAKAKGFYDKPVSIPERMALIHSELSEALEADRKDRYFKYREEEITVENILTIDIGFRQAYEDWVKGTFEEEMADVVIRILDLAGYEEKFVDVYTNAMPGMWEKALTIAERIAVLHAHVSKACKVNMGGLPGGYLFWPQLEFVLRGCRDICTEKGIDLELHVKAKMRYNSLRPRMHGGKKY